MIYTTLSVLLVVAMATLVTSKVALNSLQANNGAYKFEWALTKGSDGKPALQCFVTVKGAKGFIGLGFSKYSSSMAQADLAIASRINDTALEVADYWALAIGPPFKDTIQSLVNRTAKRDVKTDTSSMSFIRPLDTGDKKQDVVIDLNGMYVLWAYSEHPAPDTKEAKHKPNTRGYFPGKVKLGEPVPSVVKPNKTTAPVVGSKKGAAVSLQASMAVLIAGFLCSVFQ